MIPVITRIFIQPRYINVVKTVRNVSSATVRNMSLQQEQQHGEKRVGQNQRTIAIELLKKRVQGKGKEHLVLNNAELLVLGTDGQGLSPSLLINTGGKSYLFNCGEGTQRFCYTNKVKLSRLEDIFITNLDWERVSGSLGLALTLQDIGLPSLCIHGPESIEGFFDSIKPFVTFNTGMKCSTDSDCNNVFQDSVIKIQPVIIDDDSLSSRQQDIDKLTEQVQIKKFKSNSKLLAYICSFPDLPGSLDPEKCRQLQVPFGPQLAALKSGQDITLRDGRLIKSSDVCGPINSGPVIMIVECPSDKHIEQLTNNSQLGSQRSRRSSKGERQVDVVAHFSPAYVTNDSRYVEWINGFADDCKHLILSNPETNNLSFINCYRLQYLMRKLDPEMFPLLYPTRPFVNIKHDGVLSTKSPGMSDETKPTSKELITFDRTITASPLDKLCIRPKKCLVTTELEYSIDSLYREHQNEHRFKLLLAELRDLQKPLPIARQHEPQVVFLGTSSALPSKYRNTSCILFSLHHPEDTTIMLDCGEDSYGQMLRFYGPDRLVDILNQLKLIYISHHHADHHVGLLRILSNRKKLGSEPLTVIAPPGVDKLLQFHNQNFEDLSKTYKIFSTLSILTDPNQLFVDPAAEEIKSELYSRLEGVLDEVKTVSVDHCTNSCAVVMRFKVGHPEMDYFTLSYSGDARPSDNFVRVGKGSDLLIHEATFDYRSQADATLKKHSTSTEAISVARKMEAKFTILTHFSSRLAKIPYFTEDFGDNIGFAFDNMSISCPSHFPRIPIMKYILKELFKKSLSEIDEKHAREQQKYESIKNLLQNHQESQ